MTVSLKLTVDDVVKDSQLMMAFDQEITVRIWDRCTNSRWGVASVDRLMTLPLDQEVLIESVTATGSIVLLKRAFETGEVICGE